MSRKIIGVTVGSPLPKPNLMQTDPNKGDYVKGKEEFIEQFGGSGGTGADGFSPIAKVEQTANGAVVSITDKDGTTTATITDGKDGKKGESGVYILSEGETIEDAPSDASVVIDPYDENAVEVITPPRTASVGQTIVVKAVDANGKPTEWEAADFPEGGGASSWEDLGSTFEEGVVLAECTPEGADGEFGLPDIIALTVGEEYTVHWNGVPYHCAAQDASSFIPGAVVLGDFGIIENEAPTEGGEPFVIMVVPDDMAEEIGGMGIAIMPLDGSESITLSITGMVETVTPIPGKYFPQTGILYVGPNNILYKTTDTSNTENILIKSELEAMVRRGMCIYLTWDVDKFRPATSIRMTDDGGVVQAYYEKGDTSSQVVGLAPNSRTEL